MGSVGKEKSGAGLAVAELMNNAPASENKSARTSAFINVVLFKRTNSFPAKYWAFSAVKAFLSRNLD